MIIMKNIFQQTKEYVKPPKRNTFDLSFVNHSTFNFGTLYPVFCKPVIPGDSFSIDTIFALRFMPTAFPVQTKITANLHFFYVRNRNLWDGWQKFIGHTGDSGEFPYIDVDSTPIATSKLSDYLGVPTTLVGNYGGSFDLTWRESLRTFNNGSNLQYQTYFLNFDMFDPSSFFAGTAEDFLTNELTSFSTNNFIFGKLKFLDLNLSNSLTFNRISAVSDLDSYELNSYLMFFTVESDGSHKPLCVVNFRFASSDEQHFTFDFTDCIVYSADDTVGKTFAAGESCVSYVNSIIGGSTVVLGLYQPKPTKSTSSLIHEVLVQDSNKLDLNALTLIVGSSSVVDIDSRTSPFVSAIRLNALPFRAYESIYNAFYRNEQNDPFIVNGQPEYDKYLANTGSGKDSTSYELHKRNWELDFLTSAVQSPQQGIAPLVGVSMQGDFTFANKDSDGNIGYFSAKAQFDTDGNISGFQLSDKVTVNGTVYTDTSDVPEDVKRGTVYNLNQLALGGISINDFRNVNALQRWLETNIRRGYKYRDIIKSHFGVDVDYNILDMPEFIGGISEPVFSTQVNQTTETESDPLGSYAGQLSLITQSRHTIKHYCDEHGYIIGIMSIVPTPCYSQLLPKDFIKSNYLDYYFPEFGHIGMQPIDYREVAPIQVYNDSPSKLLNTFGYQRPWYDYIASVDEVHSLFRTNLRNFVLNRQFDTFPALNKEFLQVDAEQLNDIFTVQDTSDKILGQIQFKITAKRPIPMFGIPRLE